MGVANFFKTNVTELKSVLFDPDFVIDEEPFKIKQDQHKLDTVSMTVLNEQGEDNPDILSIFGNLVRRQVRALERARAAESQKDKSGEVQKMIRAILPFLDSFDRVLEAARAAEQTEQMTNWLKSIESLYFRFLNILERFGLVPLTTIGRSVDLNLHDVVEYRPTLDYPGDTVISERQKGYVYNGRLLREAQVVVAQNVRKRES